MRLEYFQMIDEVAAFDRAAKTLSARAKVPTASPVFEGHFPGHPLVPGVLLIETMAQASGYLVLGLNGLSRMPFLAGVEKAKLRKFVAPEAVLDIAASVVHEGSGYVVTKASIRSDGAAICDAELMFKIMPFPAELGEAMRRQAEAIGLLARTE
jgi:3-hydroxyacyl-[acyl-carrier-protein] dehydratase